MSQNFAILSRSILHFVNLLRGIIILNVAPSLVFGARGFKIACVIFYGAGRLKPFSGRFPASIP